MNQEVKILIVRFSSIGDIVLTTPVIRCLKQQLEGTVTLHYLTKKSFASILDSNPYLDQVFSIQRSTNEVIDELQEEQYDYIIDLHKNLRSLRVKKRLNAFSFSFDKLNFKKWLLVNFKVNRLPNTHIVFRYLDSCKALGITYDGEGLDYFIPEDTQNPLKNGFENYVVIVLGAQHATKKPTDDHYSTLVENLKGNVLLIGGKAEKALGEKLAKINSARVLNFAGETSINESALLIKNARWVISPDTGMMHIAAAFNKKIISIWGNTVPEFGMYPFIKREELNPKYIQEVKGLNCRPCSKIGYAKCPKGHFKCMEQQDWKAIAQKTIEN